MEEGEGGDINKVRLIFLSNDDKILLHNRYEVPKVKTKEVKITFWLTQAIHYKKNKEHDEFSKPPSNKKRKNKGLVFNHSIVR